MRLGDWIWRSRGRGEDLQLAYLSPKLAGTVGFQGVPAVLGSWDKVMSWGRKVGVEDL